MREALPSTIFAILIFSATACKSDEGDPDSSRTDESVARHDVGPAHDLGAQAGVKVLYAGLPEEPRGQAFLQFLRASFDQVGAIDLRELDVEAADPYHVVIADWKRRWTPDGELVEAFEWPALKLTEELERPVVALAVGGHSVLDVVGDFGLP